MFALGSVGTAQLGPPPLQLPATYDIEDLGVVNGNSFATGINDAGEVSDMPSTAAAATSIPVHAARSRAVSTDHQLRPGCESVWPAGWRSRGRADRRRRLPGISADQQHRATGPDCCRDTRTARDSRSTIGTTSRSDVQHTRHETTRLPEHAERHGRSLARSIRAAPEVRAYARAASTIMPRSSAIRRPTATFHDPIRTRKSATPSTGIGRRHGRPRPQRHGPRLEGHGLLRADEGERDQPSPSNRGLCRVNRPRT